MPVEHADPDVPLPTSLTIEPILREHREIAAELMKNHGERSYVNEAFFPQDLLSPRYHAANQEKLLKGHEKYGWKRGL